MGGIAAHPIILTYLVKGVITSERYLTPLLEAFFRASHPPASSGINPFEAAPTTLVAIIGIVPTTTYISIA
eukprot:833472-Amorphochlora_amoeboformis.AAC.1